MLAVERKNRILEILQEDKKVVESIDGVEKAEVSHEKGQAIVTLSKEVANDVLKTSVEEKDYKVTDIQ